MLNLLQQTANITQTGLEFSENNKKTEMEWSCLLNCLQNSTSQPRIMKNDSPMTLHTDKKFEKDLSGQWVWYKNQVLPTLKIKFNPSNYRQIIIDDTEQNSLDNFVAIQCFAVFSNNQILEVKLEGTSIVKFSKDKVADMRSIRLTETINSLNCRYFLFTLTAFQGRDGDEQNAFQQLEQRIQRSNQTDEIRIRALKNTLISQCISIQTRKKSLHQRVSLLCQLHPFVPNEFNRLLQMLHGENPDEILTSDIRGLYFYFSNKKIRHKIFHPFYLAARFNRAITLYYHDEGDIADDNLSEVFLKIQKEVEQTLLSDQNDDECFGNQKKKNQKVFDAKLIMQITSKKSASSNEASCQKSSKTQNYELFKSKVLNYLMPLQSNAIKIIDELDVIPSQYKCIKYDEVVYQSAYTKVFPKVLNTLFEYQEKRSLYPNYLYSVSYSAQKEETSDFVKDSTKDKNKSTIKYKSILMQKYEDKHKNRLIKIAVHNENQQISMLKNRQMACKDQQQQMNTFISSNQVSQQQEIQNKANVNAMVMNMCMQETNRKSYTSNASETVGINQQNTNIVESKQKKRVTVGDQQIIYGGPRDNDATSQISDDTHAQDDELDCFTPGDNKIKIRKTNNNSSFNQNSFLKMQNNSNFALVQDNKNIPEFQTLDPLFYQTNNSNNNLYKLKDAGLANLLPQSNLEIQNTSTPLDLANYSFLLQQIAQQNNGNTNATTSSTNVSNLLNSSNTLQQQQNQLLIQNLQQITQQNLNQPQFLHQQQLQQQQQQQQQQKQMFGVQSNQNSNNNLQNLLFQNKLNQVTNSNNSSLNQLIYENAIYQQVTGQQNQGINNGQSTFNLLSNPANTPLKQLATPSNFAVLPQQNLLQTQQTQDLLGLMQLNQKQQQQQQQQNTIQQLLNQQQQQNNNFAMSEQFNQQQLFMNQFINQNQQGIFTEVSRKSIPQQPQQQNLLQLALKQQQQQQQPMQLQQQFNPSNQFESQRLAEMLMMQQYQ